jgi:hypothetical protein
MSVQSEAVKLRGGETALAQHAMSLPGQAASPKLSRFVAQTGAGLVCALGATALLGWWPNLDSLRCIAVPGSTPLKPR